MATDTSLIIPPSLKPGDTIAICSPAGPVNPAKVEGAVKVLEDMGWKVRVMPHALGKHGNYAAPDNERLADLTQALTDPSVRAVLCSRGGYGVVHIMEGLDRLDLRKDPKWVIGYSDISALHAALSAQGIASIHASMCGDIMRGPGEKPNDDLFAILQGDFRPQTFERHMYDRPGVASGTLRGGNLAVLAGLVNTRFDLLKPDSILFIEDVSEPIYKIERILYQMRISGVLGNLRGLLVGQFTEYRPDDSYQTMEDMVRDMVASYNYPVAFNVPVGHVSYNVPVIENAKVTLKVTPEGNKHLIYWNKA